MVFDMFKYHRCDMVVLGVEMDNVIGVMKVISRAGAMIHPWLAHVLIHGRCC